ncbi:NucA/NucB deoxyribonuclease domain-containing protein [Streptomyces sp. NBC_00057]|uniref:NucA/NucB deoxyribonuclease domain-containing protein n=1 Tax=Streptomyces sp. NBC_00057 TaxID=2975634 RepID=UPI00386363F3
MAFPGPLALTSTGANLLGLVKHLAIWESRYFGEVFEEITDRYRRVWEHSRGKSCDEYPFASTKEGGATGVFSRRMINEKHNSTAGGSKYLLKAYKDNRILNGDAFWVAIS